MPQIINEGPGLGALLGSSLGTGLGSGFNQLAQNKLNQLLNRQQATQSAKGLAALGIPFDQAHQIAQLPQELQSIVLKNYLQGAESSGLDQALAGVLGTGADQGQQDEQQGLQQLIQQSPQPQQRNPLMPNNPLLDEIEQYQASQGQLQQKNSTPTKATESQKTSSLKDVLLRPRLSPEHKLKVAALQQQRQIHKEKLSAKEQEEVSKETKPSYDEINKHAKAAKENNIRLGRMETLINEGKLDNPVYSSLLDAIGHGIFGAGIDLSSLHTADSQEFKKLSNDFVKSAKDYFGSRLTDTDLKTFLKTVPNLSQTDEGKRRVINNLKRFNDVALLKRQAANEVIRENGGKRPRNFDELVDDKIEMQIDKIAQDFKKGIDTSSSTAEKPKRAPTGSILVDSLTGLLRKAGIGTE